MQNKPSGSAGGTPPRLRTRRICSLFDALATTSLMCKSHLRFLLWIVTPNTLWASTDSKALVSMAKADGRWSTTLWKRSHLLALFGVKNHIVCSNPSADVVKLRLKNWHPVCRWKFWYSYVIYILPVWATRGGQFQIVNHYYKEYRTQFGPLRDTGTYWEPIGVGLP